MNYRTFILPRALRQLENLPEETRNRIELAILALATNPRPHGCKKLRDRDGWRIRVGEYRVVYEIDDTARTVAVQGIAHRREAYR